MERDHSRMKKENLMLNSNSYSLNEKITKPKNKDTPRKPINVDSIQSESSEQSLSQSSDSEKGGLLNRLISNNQQENSQKLQPDVNEDRKNDNSENDGSKRSSRSKNKKLEKKMNEKSSVHTIKEES